MPEDRLERLQKYIDRDKLMTKADKGVFFSDLEATSKTAAASVKHVKKGNEQLRQAAERGQSFRIYMMVFLVLAGLILLFFDWYE